MNNRIYKSGGFTANDWNNDLIEGKSYWEWVENGEVKREYFTPYRVYYRLKPKPGLIAWLWRCFNKLGIDGRFELVMRGWDFTPFTEGDNA